MSESQIVWESLTPEEKRKQLFLKQKKTLDLFLERNAISKAQYDKSLGDLIEKMGSLGAKVDAIDALALAEEAGTSKAVNLVLMGRLSKYFDISEDAWIKAIEASVPAKFLELNKKAFKLGRA